MGQVTERRLQTTTLRWRVLKTETEGKEREHLPGKRRPGPETWEFQRLEAEDRGS